MYKCISAVAILFFASSMFSHADDISDAKTAFETLVEYQKTDDIKSPELFAEDCAVRFTFTDGTRKRELALTPEQFRDWLQKSIARKRGNNDVYENVKFEQVGSGVKVTATILYHETGLRGPILLVYARDAKGVLKIKEMATTVPVPVQKTK